MYYNFTFTDINQAVPFLLQRLQEDGDRILSRAGSTRELTHVGITLTQPWKRELLLPTRRHSIAAQIAETIWVLSGRDDVRWLERYLPRAKDFSDDGITWRGAYGPRLRGKRDQLQHIFKMLAENNSDRRAVAAIYDPAIDMEPGRDIPCNDFLNFSIRNSKLDLHVFVRSNDAWWGLSGINAFEWSALLEIMAGLLGVDIGSLHFSTTSLHLYEQHWSKADKVIMGASNSYPTPQLELDERFDVGEWQYDWGWPKVDGLLEQWLDIEDAIRDGRRDDVRMIEEFPEPMLQSWLRVIHWYWNGHSEVTVPLKGTRLYESMQLSVRPSPQQALPVEVVGTPLSDKINELHVEKDAAYGDSWRKRGEQVGILANIARKVDRLEIGGETSDENKLDTAIDLTVYLAKYRWWLADEALLEAPLKLPVDTPHTVAVHELLKAIEESNKSTLNARVADLVPIIVEEFGLLQSKVEKYDDSRVTDVNNLLELSFLLTKAIYEAK